MRDWLPSKHIEPTTEAAYVSNLDRHFFPFFGKKLMYQITPSLVQDWVTKAAADGLSARSIRKYHTMLHSIFKRAVRDQLIVTNPCEHTELPKIVAKKTRTLTPDEFDVLITAVPDRYRLMVETTIETGMRWGASSSPSSPGTSTSRAGQSPSKTRTSRCRRSTPRPASGSSPNRTPRTTSREPSPSVRTGSRRSPNTSSCATLAATTCCSPPQPARRSHATPSEPGSGCRPVKASGVSFNLRIHDLRHAYASWLLAGGSDLKSVMDRLGHAQIHTTQKYPHALREADQRNLDALDRMTRKRY